MMKISNSFLHLSSFFFLASVLAAEPEEVSLVTQGGPGVALSGTIHASKYFFKPKSMEESILLSHRIDEEGSVHSHQRPEKLPLSWNLGFSLGFLASPGTSTQPAVTDLVYGGRGGLGWDVLSNFKTSFYFSLDRVDSESYQYSAVGTRLEYILVFQSSQKSRSSQLRSKKPGSGRPVDQDGGEEDDSDLEAKESADSSFDPSDAVSYYQHQRKRKMEKLEKDYRRIASDSDWDEDLGLREDAADRFPNLKIAYNLHCALHGLTPHAYTRIPALGSLSQSMTLSEYQNGPELIYSPSERWSFRGGATFSTYNGSVDTFLSRLEIGNVLQSIGLVPVENRFMTFPQITYLGTIDFHLNDHKSFQFVAAYTTYKSATQGDTIEASPSYATDLSKKWTLIVGLDALYSIVASLNPLSFLGRAQLSYRF